MDPPTYHWENRRTNKTTSSHVSASPRDLQANDVGISPGRFPRSARFTQICRQGVQKLAEVGQSHAKEEDVEIALKTKNMNKNMR